jgi:GntR family transcriptional regulator, transcriptional repressor for pyruvate dehydrogenase complex
MKAPDATSLEELELREVRVRRAFEAVCDQIRQQLAAGELRPGDRLPGEREMAEQFKVSRGVVRESIRCLESMGVVEARTGTSGGVFVRASTPQGITQAMSDMVALGQMPIGAVTEARIEMTCMAIRLACARATEAELAAIEADIECHAELFRRGRGSRNGRSLSEFYRLIGCATHNPLIIMLIDSISEVMRTLLARIDPQPHPDMILMRRKVLRHMRARDPARASAALTLHLRHVTDYLESEDRAKADPQPQG